MTYPAFLTWFDGKTRYSWPTNALKWLWQVSSQIVWLRARTRAPLVVSACCFQHRLLVLAAIWFSFSQPQVVPCQPSRIIRVVWMVITGRDCDLVKQVVLWFIPSLVTNTGSQFIYAVLSHFKLPLWPQYLFINYKRNVIAFRVLWQEWMLTIRNTIKNVINKKINVMNWICETANCLSVFKMRQSLLLFFSYCSLYRLYTHLTVFDFLSVQRHLVMCFCNTSGAQFLPRRWKNTDCFRLVKLGILGFFSNDIMAPLPKELQTKRRSYKGTYFILT